MEEMDCKLYLITCFLMIGFNFVHRYLSRYLNFFLKFYGVTPKIETCGNIDFNENFIVITNHQSCLDTSSKLDNRHIFISITN